MRRHFGGIAKATAKLRPLTTKSFIIHSDGYKASPLQAGARSTRKGLRVGVVDSLGGSFVRLLKPWLDHQPQFSVATTPLADSTPSDHDSHHAPVTACSVYVVAYPAAQPARLALRFWVVANNIFR